MSLPERPDDGPVAVRARQGSPRLEALTRRLLDLVGRVTGLESTYLTVIDAERGVQHVLFARNSGGIEVAEGLEVDWSDALCRRALDHGPTATADVPSDFGDSAVARSLGLRSFVTVPLKGQDGATFGTLCGASGQAVTVSEDAVAVMETLGDMIVLQLGQDAAASQLAAQAEQLGEANATLERLASTDALTGLANRRQLDGELARACSFARRRAEPVAVVSLDVDHFKRINDAYGHGVGDEVLVGIAEHLRALTRGEDVIGRMGGDEFVLLLAATDQAGAERLAERVRAAVADKPIPTRLGPVAATVSVGVATSDGSDPAELLRQADVALYAAKAAGRNAVAADPLGDF
jgi:diguanylate cyclase